MDIRNHERAQILSLADEIWMLVDFLAGSPGKVLSAVQIPDQGKPGTNVSLQELLQRVCDTQRRVAGEGEVEPGDRAFIQLVRDALNGIAAPATGLTVAYSSMVTGPLRRRAASRFLLAQQVYSTLTLRAWAHSYLQAAVLVVAVLLTVVAGWQSAKVALGKAILQNLQTLRTAQTSLNAEKVRYELSQSAATQKPMVLEALAAKDMVPLTAYRLCDRHFAFMAYNSNALKPVNSKSEPIPAYSTPEERDICGRDEVLTANLQIVRSNLVDYRKDWVGVVGGGFLAARNLLRCGQPSCGETARLTTENANDQEFMIAPVLLVEGNFVLPVIFGCIGSAIFVVMEHYTKIRQSLLHPRDFALAPFRLVLGVVVGACIGLFFSSYGPMPQLEGQASTLISSLTLTASGVAFLAGFGVEGVFSTLGALVSRVFAPPGAAR